MICFSFHITGKSRKRWQVFKGAMFLIYFGLLAPISVKYNNISHCILIVSLLPSETDIDDCASHPCKNNGTCTDRVNGFNCSCAQGFNGTQCQTGKSKQWHHHP